MVTGCLCLKAECISYVVINGIFCVSDFGMKL